MRWAGAVSAIAADLVASAATGPDGPAWEGPEVRGDEEHCEVVVGDTGPGLYSGAAGIALFLAAAATSEALDEIPGATALARDAARGAVAGGTALLNAGRLDLAEGAAGISWAGGWTGRLLADPELVADARRLGAALLTHASSNPAGDLLGGTAGALLVALAVAGDDPQVVAAADEAARKIAASATDQPWGKAWPTAEGEVALCGLSHGASGMAVALSEASARTGNTALRSVAEAALDYERSWFDADRGGWPDLRGWTGGEEPDCGTFWCHGAAGIGLARLHLYRLWGGTPMLVEAGAAVEVVRGAVAEARAELRAGTSGDCSLCHGLASAAELMLAAARVPGGEAHAGAARRVGELLLDQRDHAGAWPCGVRDAGPAPGLFIGTAGIGLTLLRIAGATHAPAWALPGID